MNLHPLFPNNPRATDDNSPEAIPQSTYSYSMAWKDKLVDSSSFFIPWGHDNPK